MANQLLPPEIIGQIAAEISGWEDRNLRPQTLRSCSLVSKIFRLEFQPHILAKISLSQLRSSGWSQAQPPSRYSQLLELLQSNPTLSTYISSFPLELDSYTSCRSGHDPALPPLLRQLNTLTSFKLQSTIESCAIDWGSFSVDLQSAIKHICSSPTITTLEFENVYHFPPSLLGLASGLKSLKLDRVGLDEQDADVVKERSLSTQLRVLILEDIRDSTHSNTIIDMASPTLEVLTLYIPDNGKLLDPGGGWFDCGKAKNLQSVTFSICAHRRVISPLLWINFGKTIATLSGSKIREIRFEFANYSLDSMSLDTSQWLKTMGWHIIDQALAETKMVHLEEVRVECPILLRAYELRFQKVPRLDDLLPLISCSGRTKVQRVPADSPEIWRFTVDTTVVSS